MEAINIKVYKRSVDNDPAYTKDGVDFSVKIMFENGEEKINIFLGNDDAKKLYYELKNVLGHMDG